MIQRLKSPLFWLLIILLVVTFLPWLGISPYSTKGEPREAIVAVSMLQSGNWILPESFGAEIPYKPPFLAWCIATISLLCGHVTEYASRLPSAIAGIALIITTFVAVRRAHSNSTALLTALVLTTSIEVWRAAMACRVDMVLTAFIVGALFCLNLAFEKRKLYLIPAILLMSGAALTKGPIGILLPCLAVGIYRHTEGDRFWRIFIWTALAAVASCIIPAIWYVAAYHQGGDKFLSLVIEENFGRFTGSMSYESHVKPVWYNFATIALGMLPYTILALMALFVARWRNLKALKIKQIWGSFKAQPALTRFAIVITVVIFIFYCIPKSKRSVYLLPIYPFLAYFIVLLFQWLMVHSPKIIKIFARIIAVAAILVAAIMICMPLLLTPAPGLFFRIALPLLVCIALAAVCYLFHSLQADDISAITRRTTLCVMAILWCLSGYILPASYTSASERSAAEAIATTIPSDAPIYTYVSTPLLHHYVINYYLNDRMRIYDIENPSEGYVVVWQRDLPKWHERYGDSIQADTIDTYEIPGVKSADWPVLLYTSSADE